MLARTFARSREIAIRAALGANLWQMARPFLAEAAAISVAGAATGLLAARLVLRAVPAFLPGPADPAPLQLDADALGFTLAVAIGLTAILGLVPLIRVGPAIAFRPSPAGGRARSALVIAQVSLSVMLLLGAGLLLRSFFKLLATNPGFETAHALRFGIGLPEARYDTDRKLISFHQQLLERLQTIAGVEYAGAAVRMPLRGGSGAARGTFQIAGENIPLPQRPHAWINAASPGYFRAMGIPLLEGRDFSWQDDRPGVHRVAIVNRAFADTYLRDRRAVGTLLDLNRAGNLWEVIGVAGDTRQAALDREPVPEIMLSMTQDGADGAGYVIRSRTDDPGLAKAIAAAVAAQDPRIQRVEPIPLKLVVERNLAGRSATIELIAAMGGLALLLTAVGIYGIVAFRAAERSREMAIRMALGATNGQVRRLLLQHAVGLVACGLVLAVPAFSLLGRFLNGQLYGIGILDPATVFTVGATVLAVALLAAAGARTTHVDLMRE
jgi:putative ABC transport system permease protein